MSLSIIYLLIFPVLSVQVSILTLLSLSLCLSLSLSLKNLVLSVGCVRSGAQAQLLGFEDLGTLRFSCVFLLWKFWSKDS